MKTFPIGHKVAFKNKFGFTVTGTIEEFHKDGIRVREDSHRDNSWLVSPSMLQDNSANQFKDNQPNIKVGNLIMVPAPKKVTAIVTQ